MRKFYVCFSGVLLERDKEVGSWYNLLLWVSVSGSHLRKFYVCFSGVLLERDKDVGSWNNLLLLVSVSGSLPSVSIPVVSGLLQYTTPCSRVTARLGYSCIFCAVHSVLLLGPIRCDVSPPGSDPTVHSLSYAMWSWAWFLGPSDQDLPISPLLLFLSCVIILELCVITVELCVINFDMLVRVVS